MGLADGVRPRIWFHSIFGGCLCTRDTQIGERRQEAHFVVPSGFPSYRQDIGEESKALGQSTSVQVVGKSAGQATGTCPFQDTDKTDDCARTLEPLRGTLN